MPLSSVAKYIVSLTLNLSGIVPCLYILRTAPGGNSLNLRGFFLIIDRYCTVSCNVHCCCWICKPVWCQNCNICDLISDKCKVIIGYLLSGFCIPWTFEPCGYLSFFLTPLCLTISDIVSLLFTVPTVSLCSTTNDCAFNAICWVNPACQTWSSSKIQAINILERISYPVAVIVVINGNQVLGSDVRSISDKSSSLISYLLAFSCK